MIRIIDGFEGCKSCFPNGCFSLNAWKDYLDALCPMARTTVEQDAAGYDFEREILPVLQLTPQRMQELKQLHASFLNVTNGLEQRICKAVPGALEADVVLYVGLCNGAGWAVQVGERPVVLLGIEKILELHWTDEGSMHGLIDHELGHLWHEQKRTAPAFLQNQREKALWQLYSEGVAMVFEHWLCGNPDFFHQDQNGWLDWCRKHEKRLFREYLRRITAGETVQPFFGDWCSFEGVSDIGYYLGAELIERALESRSVQDLLDLDSHSVENLLRQCAE